MGDVSVGILSGFLGVGKTSVRNHLLRRRGARRVAVIMTEFSPAKLDLDCFPMDGAEQRPQSDMRLELIPDCTACSLRQRVVEAVHRLARGGRFDAIVVECPARTDPLLLAKAFDWETAHGRRLSSVARLDHLVTVVDARHFWDDYESGDSLKDRGYLDEHRTLSELLANQIECATTIILNKVDLVTDGERERLERFLHLLNPDAVMLGTEQGRVTLEHLEACLPDLSGEAAPKPGWMKLLSRQWHASKDPAGTQTFVYRARRPFHPVRWWTLMQESWPGVLRSKGYFWLASQPGTCYMWSQAGSACLYERLGCWWIAMPEAHWPTDPVALQQLHEVWDWEFGDRRIELAFIGEDMPSADMTRRLDACLLTHDELVLEEELWRALRDPFTPRTSSKQ